MDKNKIAKELLAIAKELTAGIPKIPGVSPGKLNELINARREAVVSVVSDSYHGATWTARWKVLEVNEFGDVVKADFVDAHGSEEGGVSSVGSYDLRRADAGTIQQVNVAIAQALKGTFMAKASFSWLEDDVWFSLGRDVTPEKGDIFESHGDSFYRGLYPDDHIVEVPITVKVRRAAYKKSNDDIRISAEFKA